MASAHKGVRVRLEPQDEYTHPIEAAQNFNESMYFNVFDRPGRIGGWFRLANRPNEGRGEMSCCIYLPDGRIGFMFARPEGRTNDAFDGGGMSFDVIEPFKRVTVRYRGKLCVMKNPKDMADPAYAFKNNPVIPVDLELDYEGVSPMFGGEPVNEDGSKIEEKAEESFARGHYEQHMAARGSITVGRSTFPDRRPRPARSLVGAALLAGDPLVSLVADELQPRLRNDGVDHVCAERQAAQRRHGAAQRRIRDDSRRANRIAIRRRSMSDEFVDLGAHGRARIHGQRAR